MVFFGVFCVCVCVCALVEPGEDVQSSSSSSPSSVQRHSFSKLQSDWMFSLQFDDDAVVDGQPIQSRHQQLTGQQAALVDQGLVRLLGRTVIPGWVTEVRSQDRCSRNNNLKSEVSHDNITAQSGDLQQSHSLVSSLKSSCRLSWLSDMAVKVGRHPDLNSPQIRIITSISLSRPREAPSLIKPKPGRTIEPCRRRHITVTHQHSLNQIIDGVCLSDIT